MKLETFFEKFELLAEAPDAVERLRELVLQLAVQGKLVEQDQDDEPATEIIKRARIAALGTPRLAKALRAYESREPPVGFSRPELPNGWAWTCNVELGDTSPRNEVLDDSVVAFAPMSRIPTDYRAAPDFESRPWGEIKKGFTHFADGDIAVGKITPCFQNGKSCVMSNLSGGVGAGTTELHVLRPYPETVVPLYMLLLFKSPEFVAGGIATFSGTAGQQRVSKDYFRFRPIQLPPLAEQNRIVARVDELMALCDRLEAQQQQRKTRHVALARASLARFAKTPTLDNLGFLFHPSYPITPPDLRKSILTLAVQGLLVPRHPASADWETRKLKEVTTKIGSGSTPSGGKESYQESGVPLIRSMNIHFGGFVQHGLAFLNEEQAEKLKNVMVKSDDVLLNITGASIGRVAIAPQAMAGARVNQHVSIVRPTAEVLPSYLEVFLASPVVQNHINDVQVGATRQALTKGMIEQFEIPVPPLAEQRLIVAKVQQSIDLVDELETKLATARTTGADLLDAVVAELTAMV